MSWQEEMALLGRYVEQIGEHFDTVQIFVTRYDAEEGTINAHQGAGNWFARVGQVQAWLQKRDEEARVEVRREEEE
jgi:hypothetical protein